MKTGFAVFVIGLLVTLAGVGDPPEGYLLISCLVAIAGIFLMWVGVRLMKGRGSLVDNPTLK
jgi:hypothetical protein